MKIRKIFSTITVLAMLGSAISGISALADNAQNQITPANASGQLTITLEIKEPATATYAQEGKDFTSKTETDNIASLWKVTVTPGTDAITSLDVKVNGHGSDGALTGINYSGDVVVAVAVNHAAADVESVTAVVNGSDVDAIKVISSTVDIL